MTEPPHDPAAERAVLGAALLSPDAHTDAARLLRGDEFWDPKHELIWGAIQTLTAKGVRPDAITVAAYLRDHDQSQRAGGDLYLHDLTRVETTPATSNAQGYARIVVDLAERRRAITAATRITQFASEGCENLAQLAVAEATTIHRPDPTAGSTRLGDLVDDVIEDLASSAPDTGIPWPWKDAQARLNTLSPGQFIVVAGRAAMGKSVALLDIAREAAIHRGRCTVFHTLEMSRDEVVMRILAAEARVPQDHMKHRAITGEEWERISRARGALEAAPLHIIDTPSVGIADLRGSVKDHRPELVVLDYLQLAQVNPKVDRRQGLEELTRGLKLLAMGEQVAVVAASQLNRGPEQRTGHVPMLSDLRETGAIENDADAVILVHRPDYYDPDTSRAGEVDLIVAKQRGGPTGTLTMVHQLHYARIVDAA